MQYLNLSYTPGFPPVYNFPMSTDYGVNIDVTLSSWYFEIFDKFGVSMYKNTAPVSATGNIVAFSIPNMNPQILIEGNYAYRVVGTVTSTNVMTVAYKGFVTVEPVVVLAN